MATKAFALDGYGFGDAYSAADSAVVTVFDGVSGGDLVDFLFLELVLGARVC